MSFAKQIIRRGFYTFVLSLGIAVAMVGGVEAIGSSNPQQSGSTGLQGTISAPAPATAPTIRLPLNGSTVTSIPVSVSGTCTTGLLVKLFSNNIFVGAVQCESGGFTLQADLFSGRNDLVARVYDALDQSSPGSNTVSVTFQDGQFATFGTHVSLTSNYAKRGANPGSQLTWPVVVSGGTGPYAVSVDWGDSTAIVLKSVPLAGAFDLLHVYKSAGIYKVVIKATDVNGQTAFLQVVGVANGKVTQATGNGTSGTVIIRREFVWWPFIILFPLLVLAFWLGTRYELQAIHRQIERQTDMSGRDL